MRSVRGFVVVVWLVAALGCESEQVSPLVENQRQVQATWEKIRAEPPAIARTYVSQLEGLMRADVVVQSELYEQQEEFRQIHELFLKELANLDLHMAEGAGFDIVADFQNVETLCKRCHNRFVPER